MEPSGIGGQAVIEGVMMKNKDEYAVAVRKPDNEIEIQKKEYHSISEKYKLLRLPIIRGIFAFVDSLVIGTSTLTYSASFFEEEEPKEKKKQNKTMENIIMSLTVALSIVLSVAIFILLPLWLSNLLKTRIHSNTILAVLEGIIRLTIFVIYILAISQMKDIQRVFMYHGAEHKTINCIEHGYELTVENVRKHSREHKRCGTSFLLFVIIISSVFFIFIQVDNLWVKTVVRLLLVPVIAGVSYEVIRLAGKSESKLVQIISKPGLMMQALTTREPDDSMIEVAIASVEAVFDWKAYLDKEFKSQNNVNNINVTSNNNDEAMI
ncbi:hypothetical protein lbkm_3018 [Lachnospiraceae bacterium KM106-2]|nr:hypothetical protein lbkm_3018 [Lachnospiraceae bacterium KM106-2]